MLQEKITSGNKYPISRVCSRTWFTEWDYFLTIVVYDKQKTALVDDPSDLINTVRLSPGRKPLNLWAFWPWDNLLVWSGHLDHPLWRFSYSIHPKVKKYIQKCHKISPNVIKINSIPIYIIPLFKHQKYMYLKITFFQDQHFKM
jgi:hypothetical protein